MNLSEKRSLMKRLETVIFLDVLNREDAERIREICQKAIQRENSKESFH